MICPYQYLLCQKKYLEENKTIKSCMNNNYTFLKNIILIFLSEDKLDKKISITSYMNNNGTHLTNTTLLSLPTFSLPEEVPGGKRKNYDHFILPNNL